MQVRYHGKRAYVNDEKYITFTLITGQAVDRPYIDRCLFLSAKDVNSLTNKELSQTITDQMEANIQTVCESGIEGLIRSMYK